MKIKQKIFIILFFLLYTANGSNGQTIVNKVSVLEVQPLPKILNAYDKSIVVAKETIVSISVQNEEEQKGANYLTFLLKEKFSDEFKIRINDQPSTRNFIKIIFNKIGDASKAINNQYYEIEPNLDNNVITIRYLNQLGLLYGTVTLSEYFEKTNESVFINLYDVKDYPDFSRRIISANPKPEDIFELMDFALKNKIETIAIVSRVYSWYKVDDDYKKLFEKIKEWKDKYSGPNIMQMHNIYEERQIEISNKTDLDGLKDVIKTGIINGADKIMILADDTPPFKYGEGYVLTTEKDKLKFKHMAEAHCFLMKEIKEWLEQNLFSSELYYVPPFYTYEDMNYGDMNLYKNTPWENDAYKPLYRDLNYIGLNMPDDVFIIWTGPVVRSRIITGEDIDDWTYNLKGIKPFLWDNTIYSHNAFISTPLFSGWDNNFPADFNQRTGGNGMFINCDANTEDSKAGVITVNDYMWNSQNYSSEQSLDKAMIRLYGKENSDLLFDLKECELDLRKTIGQRELWFESDTLWTRIRNIRFIHTKNPFYYHYNYTRMKALRLQLKGSVPEPAEKNVFVNQCLLIDKRRNEILNKLQIELPDVTSKLRKILLELPDFNMVQ